MFVRSATVVTAIAVLTLAACAGATHSGGSPLPLANDASSFSLDAGQLAATARRPSRVGEELPGEGVGSLRDATWHAVIGGFTQRRYAQVLAFPPGTRVTVRNLSKTTPHTLDVVEVIRRAPARFPSAPNLSVAAAGQGILGKGYASGIIQPGKSVTVLLKRPGIYLIGCAFHYGEGMRDVLIVDKNAKPGPEATPAPVSDPTPTNGPTSAPSSQPSPPGGGW